MATFATLSVTTFLIRSMIQAFLPAKKSAAIRPRMAPGGSFMMRAPALLQVTIASRSSKVMTPFDMLSSMLSL